MKKEKICEVPERYLTKRTLKGVEKMEVVYVTPWAKRKYFPKKKWIIYIDFFYRKAYIIMPGNVYAIKNLHPRKKSFLVLKGKNDYSFEELKEFCEDLGLDVIEGGPNFTITNGF